MRASLAALRATALLAILACGALCPLPAEGSGEDLLEVRPAGSTRFTIEPRHTVTGVFSISNHAFKELSLKSRFDLPAGWNLVATDLAERMYGEDRAISLVSLYVPRTAMAGRYRVGYSVRADEDLSMADSCAIEVEVLPVVRLVLRQMETPDYVIAGDIFEAGLVLTNQGNSPAQVALRAEAAGGLITSVEPAAAEIAPGEARRVNLAFATDPDVRHRIVQRVTVVAETADPAVRARTTLAVEVIPRVSILEDPYHRAPAEVTLRYVGEGDGARKSRLQAEVAGGGPVDLAGSGHISFHAVGPDSRGAGALGDPDEYFAAYRTGRFEVSLGDQSFTVSQLVEPSRYGLGARAAGKTGAFEAAAYHMKTRWDEPREEQTAASVDYLWGDSGAIGVNYLAKTLIDRDHLIGLEGRLRPLAGTDVEAEYSRGLAGAARGQAWRLGLRAGGRSAQYLIRLVHADPDFPGYFSDLNFVASTLTVTPSRDLRLGLSIRQESRNLDQNPAIGSAAQDGSLDLNADYRLRPTTNLFVGYRFGRQRDRLDSASYNTDENLIRSSLTYRAKRWEMHAGLEAGRTRDVVLGRRGAIGRGNLSLSIRPSDRQTYRGYLFINDNTLDDQSRHTTGGTSASLRLRPGTSLEASAKFDHFKHETRHDRATYRIGVGQEVHNGATARLEAYYGTYENGASSDRLGALLEVSVPVSVPLSRRPNVGSLKGRIYDAETGQAVPNVVLRLNGLTAVSDKNGRFAFPSVKADTYSLGVDRGTIGLDRTVAARLPVRVEVPAGGATQLELGVIRSSAVAGEIGLYDFAGERTALSDLAGRDLVRSSGLAGSLVELSDGEETKYTLTDSGGRFRFADLRPGTWQLKVRTEDLPENTYLESEVLELELRPGELAAAPVRVLPRQRQIRMRLDGGLIEEERRR